MWERYDSLIGEMPPAPPLFDRQVRGLRGCAAAGAGGPA
jgi:hypothetical protein